MQFCHQITRPNHRLRALTFGEMLVVCAVFLILAVIFIFSSQSAMVKTRISRVVQEQKQVARAIEAYEADHGLPPNEGQFYSVLNKGYLDQVPNDPFNEHNRVSPRYQYLTSLSERHKWVVISVGPDGVPDLPNSIQDLRGAVVLSGMVPGNAPLMSSEAAREMLTQNTYDPTNGTVSHGDVITVYGQ